MANCQYCQLPLQNENILLQNEINFDIFQLFSGQFDGLNQTLLLPDLEKANKNVQPNLGSCRSFKIDLDFNRGKIEVLKFAE